MIPRRIHATLDAASALALLAGPSLLGWRRGLRLGLAGLGLGAGGYSLLTRYDDAALAPLSMRDHLALDALQGAGACLAASRERNPAARRALWAYGAFSLAAAALTDRGPRRVPLPPQVPMPRALSRRHAQGGLTRPVADDVAWQRLGIVNVAFLGPRDAGDRGWILVDAGLPGTAGRIAAAAAARFGAGARPGAIVLTHGHFDHVGALATLARRWDAPVYAHPAEHPFLTGQASYPPGDPTLAGAMAALSALYPTGPVDVSDRLRPLPTDGSLPGLPDWRWLHTPGHAPGHVSLWREADGMLLSGDAVITVRQESALAVMEYAPEIHGPPAYFTPDWDAARRSVQALAALEPATLLAGHGAPIRGPAMGAALHALADGFGAVAVPWGGRYARAPMPVAGRAKAADSLAGR